MGSTRLIAPREQIRLYPLRNTTRCIASGGAIPLIGESSMSTGKIKWFNVQKGFGFIQPDGATKDVFLHISTVERAGISLLSEGQAVSFDIVKDRGKEKAANLKVI
jgi:cold shock protein